MSDQRRVELALAACLPERLHPVSRQFLDLWLSGELSTSEFIRWFHMPNSDYLETTQCLLRHLAGSGEPSA
jgi:hypothetical protein